MPSVNIEFTTLITVLSSVVATFITTVVLYTICHQPTLWILLFLILAAYFSIFITLHLYCRGEPQWPTRGHSRPATTPGWSALHQLLIFAKMTILVTLLALLTEQVLHGLAVTPALWFVYVITLAVVLFCIFILFLKASLLFETRFVATAAAAATTAKQSEKNTPPRQRERRRQRGDV